jgi:enoyl-CoA hydratase
VERGSSLSEEPLLIQFDGPIASLVLNRPARGNALDAGLVGRLSGAIDSCVARGARLLIFRGNGRHFCTGFDLSNLEHESHGDLLLRFVAIELLLQKIAAAPIITAAVARGSVVGAGADLFVACDHRICLPDARLSFPGSGFGIALGTRRLVSRVGNSAACELHFTGRIVQAEEAISLGLATICVSEAGLENVIHTQARQSRRLLSYSISAIRSAAARLHDADCDLAALVRSASLPGLIERIKSHRYSALASRNGGVAEPER